MFLPLGDYPNPRKPQWVTRILLGLNVAIFLFVNVPMDRPGNLTPEDRRDPEVRKVLDEMWDTQASFWLSEGVRRVTWEEQVVSRYGLIVHEYGYKPARPTLIALLVCMFLHANFLHVAGNMLYLWIFGDNVEARLGPVGYIVAYLVTGVVATVSFAQLDPSSMVPLVGASGAISGVLGYYMLWFPNNQIRVLVLFIFIMFVHVRALWVLGFYVVVDNLLPFLVEQSSGGRGGGVAYGAHLGGFVAGLAGAWLRNRLRGTPQQAAPDAYRRVEKVRWGDPHRRELLKKAMEDHGRSFEKAVREGRMEDAAHAFSSLVREGGLPPEEEHVFTLARWLYENDFVPDAAAVFRYYIRSYPRGGDLDRVHLGLGILLARRLGQPVPAREHLLQAIDLAGPDSPIAATARSELDQLG